MIGVFLAQRVPFLGHRGPCKICKAIEITHVLSLYGGICLAKHVCVMVSARIKAIGFLSLIVSACGSENLPPPPLTLSSIGTTTRTFFENLPMIQLAYDRSSSNQNVIVPVNRTLQLNEYEQLVEPHITLDQREALSIITGIGIDAGIDSTNQYGQPTVVPLPVRIGIRAREWDYQAKAFKPTTRIFSPQGMSLDGAQEFSIIEAYDPNYVFTGLGLRLREGRFTALQIQQKSIQNIGSEGGFMTANNQVILPPGWAMVGLIIAVDKATNDFPTRDPFVDDIAIFTARMVTR